MIKKTKGFTLLESLLVAGIISILLATVYGLAAKRQEALKAENQAKYVNQIITSLNDYFLDVSPDPTIGITQINASVNPPTQIISERLIPNEMIATANSLQTTWGTPAAISAVSIDVTQDGIPNNVTGYEISLTDISGNACTLLASQTHIISKAQRITINGVVVRTPGVSEPDVALITASCNDLNNTINIASDAYKKGIDSIVSSNAGGKTRNKENKLYIAPTGQNTSTGATACVGGSAWDPVVSACVCSITSKWDGNSCVAINAPAVGQAGNCLTGTFWNQVSRTCQAICPTNQVYDPVGNFCTPTTNMSKTLCIPGLSTSVCETVNNQVAATNVYEAGRHIPSTINTPIVPAFAAIPTTTTHTAQIVTSMPLNNVNGGSASCPAGTRPVSALTANNANAGTLNAPIANYDGKVCQMCVNGYWDNDRCVTR